MENRLLSFLLQRNQPEKALIAQDLEAIGGVWRKRDPVAVLEGVGVGAEGNLGFAT
jgi:hypothetical protein